MYKLICLSDPRALGIEDEQGDWDMAALEQHITQCHECKQGYVQLLQELSRQLD